MPEIKHPQETREWEYAEELGASLASARDSIKLLRLPGSERELMVAVDNVTRDLERQIFQKWFGTELKHFKAPGQITIGSRYKDAGVEYSRTLSSLITLIVLTPSDSDDLAKSERDQRYLMFTSRQTGKAKLSFDSFRHLQEKMLKGVPDNNSLGLMATILAMHDLAKLGTVAGRISEVSGVNSINHDLLLSQLTRIPSLFSEITPAFAGLPSELRKKAVEVMDSGFNIGHLAQVEGTPLQLQALKSGGLLSGEGLNHMIAENIADLGGLRGTLGTSFNESMFFVYKRAYEALDILASGGSEVAAYIHILNERLKTAGVSQLITEGDYLTSHGHEKIAKARIACFVQADRDKYRHIENSFARLGSSLRLRLSDSLSRNGVVDSRLAYMFYYLPAIYSVIIDKETGYDSEAGQEFGIEKAMRLNAHMALLAEQFLTSPDFDQRSLVLTGAKKVNFSQIGLRGFQNQTTEFVFGLDRVIKALQEEYTAYKVPGTPNEAFVDLKR